MPGLQQMKIPVQLGSLPERFLRFLTLELVLDYQGTSRRFRFSAPTMGLCEPTARSCISYGKVSSGRSEGKELGKARFQFPGLLVEFENVKLFFDEGGRLERIVVNYRYVANRTLPKVINSIALTPGERSATVQVADHAGFRLSFPDTEEGTHKIS
ncbi:MAG: hypothetical protein A3F33_00210 [Candidatus Woykebacteria bacterium RIFCSPHIGHO2_12_FULL_43_10]|uniref:Uncharacterized protein n=2 Tax=Candidatus Woykeibacteriota TaxID=1817899 RepID=A0A1G1WVZ4_9BACT|nr:MAG: hypothetical protein A2802_01930 [Candidatus Woykebacteria bacterium RIFCSPHIGHO2_01_FULL_43_29]OGY28850.1 MAG: hypothetical protein A3F33_00210 [Candidatus Woykebacteria bacterium RIFCSPHIGHO2_12_FULL_43_10]OGY30066.1 MAG: hypothetical protein A3J50_04200 [Candidatus Woykebacteria bacterium RIFCSPHIGHO2_02_FULL_43_16b]OGY31874.1 MAG: hypothetical protein A3A61_03105 [Candidatus Woykebacteria bacterium RIFCSPLOWO2_01_FULL_43_14]